MSYNYSIVLELVDENADEIDFQAQESKKRICDTVSFFNGLETRNPKKINDWNPIGKHRIKISLCSEEILRVPTKALATFTRKLLELWPELGNHVIGRRVFKGVASNEIDDAFINLDNISDVDALKLIIDLFVNKSSIDVKEMRLRNRTLESVKKCLLEYYKDGGSARP